MHCKSCNYTLWNLKEPRCPECGEHFRVSDFTFTPNTVRFRCPQCEQSYYGTDAATGHLVPPEFNCVTCGHFLRMDDMIILPAEGVEERQTAGDKHPWIEREKGYFFRPWIKTIGMSCFMPGRLIDLTNEASPASRARSFLFATFGLTALGAFGPLFLVIFGIGGLGPQRLAGTAAGFGMGLVIPLIAAFIWLLTIHALLAGTGDTKGFARTTHAFCFAAGPVVICSVPCLGFYILPPLAVAWWAINTAVMLIKAHRISVLRALFATLALPIAAITVVGLIIALAIYTRTTFPTPPTPTTPIPTAPAPTAPAPSTSPTSTP